MTGKKFITVTSVLFACAFALAILEFIDTGKRHSTPEARLEKAFRRWARENGTRVRTVTVQEIKPILDFGKYSNPVYTESLMRSQMLNELYDSLAAPLQSRREMFAQAQKEYSAIPFTSQDDEGKKLQTKLLLEKINLLLKFQTEEFAPQDVADLHRLREESDRMLILYENTPGRLVTIRAALKGDHFMKHDYIFAAPDDVDFLYFVEKCSY